MTGMWLVQLHSILDVDMEKVQITTSMSAADLGGSNVQSSPLALHLNQLTLSELLCMHVWQTDDSMIRHRFDNQFMSTVSEDMRVHVLEAISHLKKSPDGLPLTNKVSKNVVGALDILLSAGLVAGPPWKLTDSGHERLKQCLVLHSKRPLLTRHAGPLQEASTFQLVLELDAYGCHMKW